MKVGIQMSFTFQTPFDGSDSLIDAVGDGSCEAVSGGGVYAFASAKGVDLLFTQTDFLCFLDSSGVNYHLIVGIDEITNSNSLIKLSELQKRHKNLKVNAFYHKENKLFHPKFSWFLKNNGEGEVIIGSGNLTESGFSNNWEAFFSIKQCKEDFSETLKTWYDFLEEHSCFILPIDDERIVNSAKENDYKSYARQGYSDKGSTEREAPKPKPSSGALLKGTSSVLIKPDYADIESPIAPVIDSGQAVVFLAREAMTAREKGDYSQILFSEKAYTDFFKFNSDDHISYDIYNKDGYLGQVVNPSITVKASRNYAIGIASRKEGKSKGKAEPDIKSNFMLDVESINEKPPILLIAKVNGKYKVIFSHPSNGLHSLHSKLKGFLKGSREIILTEAQCNEIIDDISIISSMIS